MGKHACVLSHFSSVLLFATLWTVAHQVPLSMRFSRQVYWSGLPCPSPGDLPDPRTEPASLTSPALAVSLLFTPPEFNYNVNLCLLLDCIKYYLDQI